MTLNYKIQKVSKWRYIYVNYQKKIKLLTFRNLKQSVIEKVL